MRIVVINETNDPRITVSDVLRMTAAVAVQLATDVADMWQWTAPEMKVIGNLAEADENDAIISLFQSADQADALGYHSTTPNGRPYGKVFTSPIFSDGGGILTGKLAVSQTLSHEAIELFGDPAVNLWAETPDGDLEAVELCDRVEADSYERFGVTVSNFLGPRAFYLAGPGPYDFMNQLSSAWDMTPGGYAIRRGVDGKVRQIFAAEPPPEWKLLAKVHPAARSARRAVRG